MFMKTLPMFEPAISTVPEDSMLFSLVQKDTPQYYKLVMENYIGFMVFCYPLQRMNFLRFDNFLDWTSFKGFKALFIPEDLFKNQQDPIGTFKNMIDNDYYVMSFIDTFYISFYRQYQQEHFPHTCVIYGYDEDKQILYCKDYKNNVFMKYEMTFQEYMNSLRHFDFVSQEPKGVRGLKVDSSAECEIDFSKLYSELVKFKHSRAIGKNISGIDIFDEITSGFELAEKEDKISLYRWEETANYLKVSVYLMSERVRILKLNFPQMNYEKMDKCIEKALCTANLFFLKTVKANMKNDRSHENLCKLHESLKNIFIPYVEVVNDLISLLEEIFFNDRELTTERGVEYKSK